METLDLYVEKRIRIDRYPGVIEDVTGERGLVGALALRSFFQETRIGLEFF